MILSEIVQKAISEKKWRFFINTDFEYASDALMAAGKEEIGKYVDYTARNSVDGVVLICTLKDNFLNADDDEKKRIRSMVEEFEALKTIEEKCQYFYDLEHEL